MTRKLTFLILALFALISGPGAKAWGQSVTMSYTGTSTTNMGAGNNATSVNLDASHWNVEADKGGNNNYPGLNKAGQIRLYGATNNHNVITVTNSDGATITNITVTYSESNNNNAKVTVGASEVTGTGSDTEKTYSINSSSFSIAHNYNSNTQVYISSVVINYSASSAPSITVTNDNVTLDYNATEGQFNYSISNPATGVNMVASTEDSWISNITVNTSNVTFTTTENEAQTQRVGTITLSYTGATSKVVTVTQAAAPQEGVLFYESFDTNDGTGGNDGFWSGSIASNDLKSDNEGWTFVKGNGANKCAKFGSGSAKGSAETPSISCNGNATLTFKAAAWNGSSESTTLNISATNATLSQASVTLVKGEWTEYSIDITNVTNSTQITFEAKNASNNRFFLDEVKVLEAEAPSVATPTFNPTAGTYTEAQDVTITCETEGASIYYTLDGSTPTNASTLYTSAIAVSETTTIKAIAYVGDEASNVATATYTILTPLTTMDEIFAAATEAGSIATDILVTFNNWVISGVKGSNAYLTDNAGKGLIIYTSDHGFAVGDVLNGTIACQIKLYSGASELMGVTSGTSGLTVTKNGEITIHEVSIADLSGVNTGAVIKVNNVQYNGTNLVDENSNIIKPYNAVDYNPTFTNGLKYNVTGVYIQFNTTKEIAPRSADDIVPTEPSITVAETLNLPYTESEVETLEVSYENVDFNNIELTLYDVTGATFTGDWFIAYFDEDFNIEYYALANTSSSERKVDIEIYAFGTDGVNDITRVIHVTQAAAPATYNVTLSSNGVVGEPQPVQGSITLSDPTNIPTGFTFAGWTESESNIQIVDNPYTPTSNVILYAVFSRVEGGSGETTWDLVTNSSEIVAGKVIKIAATVSGASVEANNGTFAANGTISSSIMGKVSATISDNKLTNDEGAAEFTIGGTSGNWTLAYDGKLLGATAAKKLAYDYGTTTWSISIGEDAKASIANGTNSYGTILYNRDNPRFTTYTSDPTASMVLPQIFVKTVSGTTHCYTRVYDEDTELATLTVAGPSIILSGKTLTVTGDMSNGNPANLVIEDGAQLYYTNGENVNATFQKNITGYTGDNDNYYLIANPTDNTTVANLINPEGYYDLYTFNGAAELEWINMKSSPVVANDGIGYLYANSANVILGFAGEIIPAGSTDINLNYANKEFGGFNLIGNPFACNAYVGKSFYVIDGSELVLSENNYVAPCEGFFVEATEAGQSATISTTDPEAPSALSLTVSQNRGNVIDRAIVNFNGSNNLHKFMMNPAHTNLSIAKGGETFAAISTEAEGELPVNFKAEKNGTYTITVNTKNVDAEYLHLIDNMTGMDVDLLSTPSYTFEAKTSDYASRFKLVFGVNNTASESSDSNFAFMSDGNLVINNIEGEATLQIVDELGRVISTETVSGSYNKALNLKAGLYIINLNGMTQKIVVK